MERNAEERVEEEKNQEEKAVTIYTLSGRYSLP